MMSEDKEVTTEETVEEVKKEKAGDPQDPLDALSPEAKKIFEETNAGLLSALKKEREANKAAADRLATIEKENQTQLEKQLVEQGKYKELAEERARALAELQPKADKLDSAEATLQLVLDGQILQIPEDKRKLIPDYGTVEDRLNYIAANGDLLRKAEAFDIGASSRGGKSDKKSVVLTDEQKQMAKKLDISNEDYANKL
jgi:hypothetical protein